MVVVLGCAQQQCAPLVDAGLYEFKGCWGERALRLITSASRICKALIQGIRLTLHRAAQF